MKGLIVPILCLFCTYAHADYKLLQMGNCMVRTQLGMFPMQCVRFEVNGRVFTNIVHPKKGVIGTNETINGRQVPVDSDDVLKLIKASQGTRA